MSKAASRLAATSCVVVLLRSSHLHVQGPAQGPDITPDAATRCCGDRGGPERAERLLRLSGRRCKDGAGHSGSAAPTRIRLNQRAAEVRGGANDPELHGRGCSQRRHAVEDVLATRSWGPARPGWAGSHYGAAAGCCRAVESLPCEHRPYPRCFSFSGFHRSRSVLARANNAP